MASVVRFTLPEARTLYVSGVGVFVAGVFDVDVNDIAQIERVRYRVQPYGAVEVGIVDELAPVPSLPAVPVAPPVDPYPQYLTPSELLDGDGRVLDSRIPDRLSEVAQRAAFGALDGDNAWTGIQTWRGAADGSPIVAKPNTDKRAGVHDLVHDSDTGYLLHFTTGANADHNTSALIALGIDNDGIGLLIPNKKTGRGIVGDQRATVTAADAYWLHATQRSANAPLVRLEAQAAGTTADVLQLLSFSGTTGGNLLYVGDASGQVGAVFASTGRMEWRRPITVMDKDGSTGSYFQATDNSGIATASRKHVITKKDRVQFFNPTGTAGSWWPFELVGGGSYFTIRAGGSTTETPGSGANPTTSSLITMQNAKMSFFGATPVAQPARPTDLAGVIALLTTLGLSA